MNRNQMMVLVLAAASLALILLFPPYDQYSVANSKAPSFAGFYFYLASPFYGIVNTGVLMLEIFVVLINAGIGWLLLRDKRAIAAADRRIGCQNAALIVTGVNLILVVAFPPFESVFALTNAALPSFEGFYPIVNRQPHHTIVTTLLQLEIIFILVHGALAWLIFKQRSAPALTAAQVQALAQELRRNS